MPEPPVAAWKYPHVHLEASAVPQLPASSGPGVSRSWRRETGQAGESAGRGRVGAVTDSLSYETSSGIGEMGEGDPGLGI